VSRSLLKKVLLVVDGAEPSIAAANYAVQLACQTGAQVTAFYVVDTATMEYLMQMHIFVSDEREEFERDLERTGGRYLEYVRTIGANHGVTIETIQRKGAFHQAIVREAREQGYDTIVLGGWRRTVMAKDATSVERQLVLDEADCPVIIVKEWK